MYAQKTYVEHQAVTINLVTNVGDTMTDTQYTEDKLQALHKVAEGDTQKSVIPKTFWILALIFCFAAGLCTARIANADGYPGIVLEDYEVCEAEQLDGRAIKLLQVWTRIMNKVLAWRNGTGPRITNE